MWENTCSGEEKFQQPPRPNCRRLCVPQRGVSVAGKVSSVLRKPDFPSSGSPDFTASTLGCESFELGQLYIQGTWASLHSPRYPAQPSPTQPIHSCVRKGGEAGTEAPFHAENHAMSAAASGESLEDLQMHPIYSTPVVCQSHQSQGCPHWGNLQRPTIVGRHLVNSSTSTWARRP